MNTFRANCELMPVRKPTHERLRSEWKLTGVVGVENDTPELPANSRHMSTRTQVLINLGRVGSLPKNQLFFTSVPTRPANALALAKYTLDAASAALLNDAR